MTLPPAGTYEFDLAHTTVEFVGTHIFTKVRGRFTDFDGSIAIAEEPEDSKVEVTIEAASLADQHRAARRSSEEPGLPERRDSTR